MRLLHLTANFLAAISLFPHALLLDQLALGDQTETISFGSFYTHKTVKLQRRLPPVIDVSGKTVTVHIAQLNGANEAAVELRSAIETILTEEGSGVRVEGSSADLTIDCQITTFEKPTIESTADGKTSTEIAKGALEAVCRIRELRTNRLVTEGKAAKQIAQVVGAKGDPGHRFDAFSNILRKQPRAEVLSSTLDVRNTLVEDVAKQVAGYLVTTTETVEVPLAVGKPLEPANKLAMTSLWARDLETLEAVLPFADPRADAYRIYNIGVANEALSYAAQDPKASIKYLQEASLNYGRALADRPEERYFLDPQIRIKAALEHYMPTRPAPYPIASAKGGEPPVNNDDVIAMVQAKMDEANILDTVKKAPKVDFDLSAGSQVRLARSGVRELIIAAMKQRVRGTSATASAVAEGSAPEVDHALSQPSARDRAGAAISPSNDQAPSQGRQGRAGREKPTSNAGEESGSPANQTAPTPVLPDSASQVKQEHAGKARLPNSPESITPESLPDESRKSPEKTDEESLNSALKRLPLGKLAYDVPERMKTGQTAYVTARIGSDEVGLGTLEYGMAKVPVERLPGSIKGSEPPVESTKITPKMKMMLKGADFEITPVSSEEQGVGGDTPTTWEWHVVPKHSGKLRLHLAAVVELRSISRDYTSVDKDITVQVDPVGTAKKFAEQYWQWVLTSFTAVALATRQWWRKRRKPTSFDWEIP